MSLRALKVLPNYIQRCVEFAPLLIVDSGHTQPISSRYLNPGDSRVTSTGRWGRVWHRTQSRELAESPSGPIYCRLRIDQCSQSIGTQTLILHACMQLMMSGADTSVRVSRATLRDLEQIRVAFNVRTADEAIRKLIRERRSRALDRLIGSGEGKLHRFTEADRLESHY